MRWCRCCGKTPIASRSNRSTKGGTSHLSQDVACLRGVDEAISIHLKQKALSYQLSRRRTDRADKTFMVRVPLLEREPRVAARQPLRLGSRKRYERTGQTAKVRAAMAGRPYVPAHRRAQRHSDLHWADPRDVEAVLVGPGHEHLVARPEDRWLQPEYSTRFAEIVSEVQQLVLVHDRGKTYAGNGGERFACFLQGNQRRGPVFALPALPFVVFLVVAIAVASVAGQSRIVARRGLDA